jgi:serine/threonine protein kinase/tetratricopeptide (TPR) repeat protein
MELVGGLVGGKYRIERALGEGGMGAVFVAVQEPLGRRVALKVIRGTDIAQDQRDRFAREATVVAALKCPHVVTLYDFGEHDGAPYIVMELLDGETLRQRMERGAMNVDDALGIARDLGCALRSAHEAGIVHRDLKPENVVLARDRDRGTIAKLLDFGIAKLAARTDVPGVTQLGLIVGTPGYMAPEVILHGRRDEPPSDVYAMGVVLYEMVFGVPPFSGATPFALMMAHAHEPVSFPAEASPRVVSLLQALLAKEPAQRPRDGAALVEAIDRARTGTHRVEPLHPTEAAPLPLPTRPSVAVQPFLTLGDDDETFAEGISEDILTALSCFKQIFVVSMTSMVQREGRDSDPMRVSRLLGVRYVLQGSVRRAEGRVRISAKLVDGSSGAQVWAQKYDRELNDLFEVQDEVTRAIVACVAGRIEEAHAEVARRKAPHALAAYDWMAKGRALHHRRLPEANLEARRAIDRAVEIDPDYAQAHAWRSCIYGQGIHMNLLPFDTTWPIVEEESDRALALDDRDAECQRLACEIQIVANDFDRAWYHHEVALELNPNDARIVGQRGELLLYRGDLNAAAEWLEKAARLDPLSPKPYLRHLAITRYMQRDLDEAAKILKRLAETRFDMMVLAIAVARLRGDSAEEQAAQQRLAARGAVFAIPKKPFVTDELRARWREGFERS